MTPKINIVCRADGSHKIGLGHLMRMLALAQNLDTTIFTPHLVTNSTALPEVFTTAFSTIKNIEDNDFELLTAWDTTNTVLALDGYDFDIAYQTRLREAGYKVALISDYPLPVNCSLVFSNNGDLKESEFTYAQKPTFCLGAEYTLLQPSFLKAKNPIPSQPYVFLALGGSDPNNFTNKILRYFSADKKTRIKLIVGSHYEHHKELETTIAQSKVDTTVYQNLKAEELAPLMCNATYGITSASTMALEFLSQNPNLLIVQTADNQHRLFDYLIKSRLAAALEKDKTPKAPKNKTKIDFGKNPRRINSALLGLFMTVQNAVKEDSKLLFDWANDPATRAQSFNKNPIPYSEHAAWFETKLANDNSVILLFRLQEIPMGVVRYEVEGSNATINYSLANNLRGLGLAAKMVEMSIVKIQSSKHLRQITAFVKESNLASVRIFEKLNFTKTKAEEYKDSFKFTLPIK